ncbi:MAG: hypothetical protein JWM53_4250, partial [bacterium]|nr:hypothetical protein [bacterium]
EACGPLPMPAEVVAPKGAASGGRSRRGECVPRASKPLPPSCFEAPRLDTLPLP